MSAESADEGCDLLIQNAQIWAGNPPVPEMGWMALSDGRVSAIGGLDHAPPSASRVMDGHGKVVLPSFVDCHTHLSASALLSLARNGRACTSRSDALAMVERAARLDASSAWLVFFYMDWDAWAHPLPPTAQELEEASGGRKVFLICDSLHRGVLSESGLRACDIVHGGHDRFVETKRGQLNGVVWETTFSRCLQMVFEALTENLADGALEDLLLAEVQRHLAYGITAAHDPGVGASLSAVMQRVNARSPMRLSWSEVGMHGPLNSAGSQAGEGMSFAGFGDGPSSAKVFADGAHRCSICVDAADALRIGVSAFASALQAFSPAPIKQLFRGKTEFRRGRLYSNSDMFTPADLSSRLSELGESHARIKIHALGNGAVDMACNCVQESGLTTQVCIEHATFIDRNSIEKLARQNVQVSLQTGFLAHYGPLFLQMNLTGKVRGIASRSMLDAGVDLILSSDNPCGPLDPLHNLRCAVRRKLPDGRTYLEGEALTPAEAIRAYTVAGQKGISGEEKQGLQPGAPADFVILTGDPLMDATVVESTWIWGVRVYSRPASGG